MVENGDYMDRYELIGICHFGLEAVLKKEITDLGLEISEVTNGRVCFFGGPIDICRANIFLRTADRILIKVGEFEAYTFTELFDKTKALDWERYIPSDAEFPVAKASSVNSKLFSTSDIQSIVKKAVVEKLKLKYNISWFEENGAKYPIRVSILKDKVTVMIDTSGESLHKRGYRKLAGKAPISETLASAIIMLTPWHKDRILVDPFCGSGTIPIEAALIACNIAPGLDRDFLCNDWFNLIDRKLWYEVIDNANDIIVHDVDVDIQGYDIDPAVIKVAMANASAAGVERMIHFQQREVAKLSHHKKYGFIITNPPYGERLEDKESLIPIYKALGDGMKRLDTWSEYVITSYEEAEKYIGRKADKNRKIYNGMIKTYLYSFLGPKPPKRKVEHENKI